MDRFEKWFEWALENDEFPSYNNDTKYIAEAAWNAAVNYVRFMEDNDYRPKWIVE